MIQTAINTANYQAAIESILCWPDDRYSKFMYECGISYLHHYIGSESTEVIDEIKRSKVFWDWWKEHWRARDQAFLETIAEEIRKDIARQTYHALHDPATLAAELHPNGMVLGESYAAMIEHLNKEVLA